MASKKKEAEVTETKVEEVAEEAPKKVSKKAKKAKEEVKEVKPFALPTLHDYEVIVKPVITEKSMALMQNMNKVTVRVSDKANKIEIKDAFQRIFQVGVVDVKVSNHLPKETTRGGRYKGTISGYKKAVVTLAEGAALDLFKE